MKIAVKESKRGNIAAMRKRLKTVSQRRGGDETKNFLFHPIATDATVAADGIRVLRDKFQISS